MTGLWRGARCVAITLALAGCAQLPSAPEISEPAAPVKLGPLDLPYDQAKWRWVKNADGRALLTHTEVRQCFVDPDPPLHFNEPGLTVKRDAKTIGGVRYEVVSAFEKRDFWEAVYVRPGSNVPVLGVYAAGRCQEEAERLLQNYETGVAKKR